MLNCAVIMGRLSAKPELRQTSTSRLVTSFSVAVDRSYVKQGEERQTDWIDCVAWAQTADFIVKHFDKGSMIAIQGHIQTRNYDDKNGNHRKAVELVVEEVSFCGEKNQAPKLPEPTTAAHQASDGLKEIPVDEEPLPF